MKTNKTQISQIVLILAAVAAVAALVLSIVYEGLTLAGQICLGVGIVGLVASIILDPSDIRNFFSGRQAKYGTNSLILILAVLAILIVINLIGYNNDIQWDLTADKMNSLSPETLNVLKSLDQMVTAQAFFTTQTSTENAETLLRITAIVHTENLVMSLLTQTKTQWQRMRRVLPVMAVIVLESGDAKEIVTTISEQEITSALLRLMSPEDKVIYVLTGHGEPTFDSYDNAGYAYAVSELKRRTTLINELNLLSTNSIPDDAKVNHH